MAFSLTEILRLSSSKLHSFWTGFTPENGGQMTSPGQSSVLIVWQIAKTLNTGKTLRLKQL